MKFKGIKDWKLTSNGIRYTLENEMVVSVVGGKGLYGDGENTFEVGIWEKIGKGKRSGKYEFTTIKIAGHQSKDEVQTIIDTLTKFN